MAERLACCPRRAAASLRGARLAQCDYMRLARSQEALPPLIVKTYGEAHAIPTAAIVMVIDKQRVVYEP